MPTIFDETITSEIDALRFSASLQRKIEKILRKAKKEIITHLARIDPLSPNAKTFQDKRLEKLNEQIKKALGEAYSKANSTTRTELQKYSIFENATRTESINIALGANILRPVLSENRLKAIATSTLIDGDLIGNWWKQQSRNTRSRLMRSMRDVQGAIQTGLVKGEALGEMVGRIRGRKGQPSLMDVSLREARSLVQTSVMQVHNDTAQMLFDQNQEVIKAYQWISTLDKQTTPICRALDNKKYTIDFKPIGHNIRYVKPPRHWGCRSVVIMITKTWEELYGQGTQRQKKVLNDVSPKKRAAMGGPIPGDMTYNQWLKTQSKRVQIEVLGPGRWKLWSEGKIGMIDMVNQYGRPLTIKQLKAKVARKAQRRRKRRR